MDEGVRKQKNFITGLVIEERGDEGARRRYEDGGGRKGCSGEKDRSRGGDQWFRHGQPPLYFVPLLS